MRLSYKGDRCTVRYAGRVPVWAENAYGVEWDVPTRGRHDGMLDGHRYFRCRVPNSGSFVKASKESDATYTIAQAIKSKYQVFYETPDTRISGRKSIQTVGLRRLHSYQENLRNLKTLSLQNCSIDSFTWDGSTALSSVTTLDLSNNLFEGFDELCAFLQPLSVECLNLSGNRFSSFDGLPVHSVRALNLYNTLVTAEELPKITTLFPEATTIGIAANRLCTIPHIAVDNIDLAQNEITSLTGFRLPATLIVSDNKIETIENKVRCKVLDVRNQPGVLDWSSIDNLQCESVSLTRDDADRPFIIARLPDLEKLNGSSVTELERTEAELYTITCVLNSTHPALPRERWEQLLVKYGRSESTAKPNSIRARAIKVEIDGHEFSIVKTATVQRLVNMVGRRLQQRLDRIQLVHEGLMLERELPLSTYLDGAASTVIMDLRLTDHRIY